MKKYLCLIAAILLTGAASNALAQFPFPLPQSRYARGQDVGPTYEGWDRNPDGTTTSTSVTTTGMPKNNLMFRSAPITTSTAATRDNQRTSILAADGGHSP